jgi:hypothetical protein
LPSPPAPRRTCWVDLMTSDPAKATQFYIELFGWKHEVGDQEKYGGYITALKDGQVVPAKRSSTWDAVLRLAWRHDGQHHAARPRRIHQQWSPTRRNVLGAVHRAHGELPAPSRCPARTAAPWWSTQPLISATAACSLARSTRPITWSVQSARGRRDSYSLGLYVPDVDAAVERAVAARASWHRRPCPSASGLWMLGAKGFAPTCRAHALMRSGVSTSTTAPRHVSARSPDGRGGSDRFGFGSSIFRIGLHRGTGLGPVSKQDAGKHEGQANRQAPVY